MANLTQTYYIIHFLQSETSPGNEGVVEDLLLLHTFTSFSVHRCTVYGRLIDPPKETIGDSSRCLHVRNAKPSSPDWWARRGTWPQHCAIPGIVSLNSSKNLHKKKGLHHSALAGKDKPRKQYMRSYSSILMLILVCWMGWYINPPLSNIIIWGDIFCGSLILAK